MSQGQIQNAADIDILVVFRVQGWLLAKSAVKFGSQTLACVYYRFSPCRTTRLQIKLRAWCQGAEDFGRLRWRTKGWVKRIQMICKRQSLSRALSRRVKDADLETNL